MHKRTSISQLEVTNSAVFIRLSLVIIDGEVEAASSFHRSGFAPNASVTEQIKVIDDHLEQMGYPKISDDDAVRIREIAQAAFKGEYAN